MPICSRTLHPSRACLVLLAVLLAAAPALAEVPGESGALGPLRITQEMVSDGTLSLDQIREQGERIFSTSFNVHDGYGDGSVDPDDPLAEGGRPTLDGNGTFLRINGLDAQSCLECHSIVSNATIPPRFGVGGVGGFSANAFPRARLIDVEDAAGKGYAEMVGGRIINPPFLFGSGPVELLAKEMTAELQELRREAEARPGTAIPLVTKGVSFGSIRYVEGVPDTSQVEGIDTDLVVRPFGRKGEFATTRAFDVGAMSFHFGIQPVETVGANVDADEDGVVNELTVGEMSALHVHNAMLPPSRLLPLRGPARAGRRLFRRIGCADCHVPMLVTEDHRLPLSFPEVETEPYANVYRWLDLTKIRGVRRTRSGSIRVHLYADLKRHDMGPELAEDAGDELDRWFTTARLWGVADTAPYLHDGRATTLTEAIVAHGGEAEPAREGFEALSDDERIALLGFLRSLRTPR